MAQDRLPEGVALLHQLVVPTSRTVAAWQIGKIIGFDATVEPEKNDISVMDIQNNDRYLVGSSDVHFLSRQKTNFPKPQ